MQIHQTVSDKSKYKILVMDDSDVQISMLKETLSDDF